MIPLLGKLLIELRDDTAFGMWHEDRVRGEEAAPVTATYDGDAHGPGEYKRFVVISQLDSPRHPRVPLQRPTFAVNVFGLSPKDAMDGYALASDAVHRVGVRMAGTGSGRVGIFNSFDDTGATPERDPQTGQPFVTFVVHLNATDQSVAS